MTRPILRLIVSRDGSNFIDSCFRLWREPLPDCLYIPDGVKEAVRLSEERVLLYFRALVGGRNRIEVVGNKIQRDPRFVILMIKKILKLLRVLRRSGQRQTYELGLRSNTPNGLDD